MPVTEYERHQLFTWFEEHMGHERAATMMNLVPPVGWADVATRRDVEEFKAAIRHDLDEMEARLAARIETVVVELDAKLGGLRSELLRTFGTWLFASQAAVIVAVSVLVAFG